MGKWQKAEWYDDTEKWMRELVYKPPWPKKAWWAFRFNEMVKHIPDMTQPILDLGCGNGLFPAFLNEAGYKGQYVGLDFSEGSLQVAQNGNWEQGGLVTARFFQCDLEKADVGELLEMYFPEKRVGEVLCTSAEVLEHMQDDLRFVRTVPTGAPVMITVPQFNSEAHVRWFPKPEDVMYRYGPLFVEARHRWIRGLRRPKGKHCHMLTGVRRAA